MSLHPPHLLSPISLTLFALVAHCSLASSALAELQLHSLFTDHAVLQQGQSVPIWGTADPDQQIRVQFDGQTKTTTSQADGKWILLLDALSANASPQSLTVSSNDQKLKINDILIGEVWLCSGQSNMARNLFGMEDKADVIADTKAGHFENIRLFKAPLSGKNQPQTQINSQWATCSEISVHAFSGTGFYFGRALHRDLGVPIGLIQAAYGGTNASCWISKNTLENNLAALTFLEEFNRRLSIYPAEKKLYDQKYTEWKQQVAEAKKNGLKIDVQEPWTPMGLNHPKQPAGFYNGMIAPLQPYAIAGVIWSQGESNATRAKKAAGYKDLLLALISGWRADWAKKIPGNTQRNFPFYQVQLPNFSDGDDKGWPIIREQMLQVWQQGKNTGMVVTIDAGNPDDIHPQNKRLVGDRLARFARANAYGEPIVYSGPIYREMQADKNKITLHFDHIGSGLLNKDGKTLRHFTIAAEDGKFVAAEARIEGKQVIVSSPQIKNPQAVRYAWSNNPENPNLFNIEGLPASPFRTDTWDFFTKNK